MANETHTLKIGDQQYSLYGNGVMARALRENYSSTELDSHPLCLMPRNSDATSSGIAHNAAVFRQIYGNNNLFASVDNIMEPADGGNIVNTNYEYSSNIILATGLKPTPASTRFTNSRFYGGKHNNSPNSLFMLGGIYQDALNQPVIGHQFILNPGDKLIVPETAIQWCLTFWTSEWNDRDGVYVIPSGPYRYTLTNYVYSLLLLIDDISGDVLKTVNSNTFNLTNNKYQVVSSFFNTGWDTGTAAGTVSNMPHLVLHEFTIPSFEYTNTTSEVKTVHLSFVPFSVSKTWSSDTCYLPIPGNTIYSGINGSTTRLCYEENYELFSTLAAYVFINQSEDYKVISANDNICNLSNSDTIKTAFANNGVWVGNMYNQVKLANDELHFYGNNIKESLSDVYGLSLSVKGNFPKVKFTHSTIDMENIGPNLPKFTISTATNIVFDCNENSAFYADTIPIQNSNGISLDRKSRLGISSSKQWSGVWGVNIYKNGSTISTSDERYKDFMEDIDVDFNKLKSIPKKKFTWKEGRFFDDYKVHFGTSAQKVKEIYPELSSIFNNDEQNDINDDKAILGVDYSKLSLVALAAIDKLNDRIESLMNDIDNLQKENEDMLVEVIKAETKCDDLEEKLIDLGYGND